MSDAVWKKAIVAAAVPERARHAWEQLRAVDSTGVLRDADAEQARIFAALASGSEWATECLVKHPEWLPSIRTDNLAHPRRAQGLRAEVEEWFAPSLQTGSYTEALANLRRFKQREMIRIAARDLARLGPATEIIEEISDVADVCLSAVLRLCHQQLTARFGSPFEEDASGAWRATTFCVLGMGKLGGQELNYSSDVDVLFVYSDEGGVFKEPPRKGKAAKPVLTNHQFFTRLAEAFINEVGKLTEDGMLFRIDLRLRPEGDAGPLVRSLGSYENYYAQWGQTWERMMLIKARCVAGDRTLAGEFLEMVQPFRYPRSVSENVLAEIAAIKQRIETEVVKSGELERNVKLGRGGIREIEFTAQTLQLLHGGRNPFLQGAQTLPTLQKLAQYQLLAPGDADALARAYPFLRDVEHRLQMEHNRQTHTLPVSPAAQQRMAALMGFKDFKAFEKERAKHSERVRAVYERLLQSGGAEAPSSLPRSFDESERWKTVLGVHAFRDPAHATKLLREFALGPGFGHVSQRTTELAMQLIPKLLSFCPPPDARTSAVKTNGEKRHVVLSDPDRVVARLDSFVAAYGARATLYEMWSSNPSLFELMLFLFDRSEFLAEVAIRTPDLVDDLVLSGHLRKRKDAPAILEELGHGARDEDQQLWIRRYHRSELMRIGLRDILGLADYEQNFEELTALADACLQYALEVIGRKHKLKALSFAIIGFGKLGGAELNYGSDLDITFVAPASTKNLSRLQSLAVELMDLLSSQTEMGVAFETDARLRPDGEKGLLVNTLPAYEEYYRKRAQLWEIQSLTRTRFIAGDKKTGDAFQKMAAALTDFSAGKHAKSSRIRTEAFTPDWKEQIAKMRARIEKERTPRGKDALAIKTGSGGLIDAEFIAQMFSLERGWSEPNTLRALQRAEREKAIHKREAEKLIENYRKLRRVEAILRRWSYAGETVLPDDPAPLYRVAVRCGFGHPDEFMRAVTEWRKGIRDVYHRVLEAALSG
jgi:[glutamine synthetase] adenylyltransferase / [glutamine synthetase]-adenylyl-L-tyrosine phosphorylase